jgi:hypothetical protein
VLESRRIHRESLVVSAVRMSSGPPERDAHHAGTRPAADEVVRRPQPSNVGARVLRG